jgi:rod shape-determining protein MreD
MSILIGIPVLAALFIVQSAIVSMLPLLSGSADLVLLVLIAWALQDRVSSALEWALIGGLMSTVVTRLPFPLPLVGYLGVTLLARGLRSRVWQTPFLAMFLTTFLGTVGYHGLVWLVLTFQGTSLPLLDSLNFVIFPATLLNLVLALPVYALVSDLAQSLYPDEVSA